MDGRTHDTLHVGYLENYLPYSDTDEQGKATGIVKDIIPRSWNGLGMSDLTVTYTGIRSYDEMIPDMSTGRSMWHFP